jgi:FtsZ-binding cell division protein ZapB
MKTIAQILAIIQNFAGIFVIKDENGTVINRTTDKSQAISTIQSNDQIPMLIELRTKNGSTTKLRDTLIYNPQPKQRHIPTYDGASQNVAGLGGFGAFGGVDVTNPVAYIVNDLREKNTELKTENTILKSKVEDLTTKNNKLEFDIAIQNKDHQQELGSVAASQLSALDKILENDKALDVIGMLMGKAMEKIGDEPKKGGSSSLWDESPSDGVNTQIESFLIQADEREINSLLAVMELAKVKRGLFTRFYDSIKQSGQQATQNAEFPN